MLRHQTSAPKRRRVPQKRGFQFLLSLLFLLPHAFAGTDTVGNAGLVENQFVYVWVNLARYLNVCTQASDCAARVGLSESESAVLRALRATVNSGGVSPLKPLHFAPDRGQGSDPWSAVLSLSPSGFAVIHSRALYSDSEAVRAGGALHESLPYLTVAAGLLTEKPIRIVVCPCGENAVLRSAGSIARIVVGVDHRDNRVVQTVEIDLRGLSVGCIELILSSDAVGIHESRAS